MRPVEAAARIGLRPPRRPRPAQHLQPVLAAVEGERAFELAGGMHAVAGSVGVEAEQRPHRHPQRELARPGVEVELEPVLPRIERPLDLLVHHRTGGQDALVVEGRQHRPARLAVEVAVDREHPVAQQREQVAEAAVAPAEAVGVGDEHEVVRLGSEQEDVARVEDPQREHGPVALVGLEQQRERVDDHAVGAPQARPGVPGRVAAARAVLGLQLERDPPQGVRAQRLRTRQGHRVNLSRHNGLRSHCDERTRRERRRAEPSRGGPGRRAVLFRLGRQAAGRARR
jgi:hypothetical protein